MNKYLLNFQILNFSFLLFYMVSCKKDANECSYSDIHNFQAKQIYANNYKDSLKHPLGFNDKEIAITFDDGPSENSVKLAKFLVQEKVSATFFVIGNIAKNDMNSIKLISEMTIDNKPAHLIANHTWSHTNLTGQSITASEKDILNTEKLISSYIKGTRFFRAPHGAWGGENMMKKLNSNSLLSKYIGPIFWDIGGELSDKYAADWACWSNKVSVKKCADKYVKESFDRGRGILLAHDSHLKTIELFMGNSESISLIKRLREKGFKFVRLDAYPTYIKQFGQYVEAGGLNNNKVLFFTKNNSDGSIIFDIDFPEANLLTIYIDKQEEPLYQNEKGPHFSFKKKFTNIGIRQLTIEGRKNNKFIGRDVFSFKIEKININTGEQNSTNSVVIKTTVKPDLIVPTVKPDLIVPTVKPDLIVPTVKPASKIECT